MVTKKTGKPTGGTPTMAATPELKVWWHFEDGISMLEGTLNEHIRNHGAQMEA